MRWINDCVQAVFCDAGVRPGGRATFGLGKSSQNHLRPAQRFK